MASTDIQGGDTNGHVHRPDGADNGQVCGVEHEDSTDPNPVEPRDGPGQEKQVRSAERDDPATAQDKHKPRLPSAIQTTAKASSGAPTPQVKKVPIFRPFLSFVTLSHMHLPHCRY